MAPTKPSRQVLNALPFKAHAFLHGVGTSRVIRAAMVKVGYTADAHAEGWALLERVSGRACSFVGLTPRPNEARAAVAALVAWEKANLRRLRAAIAHEHPTYAASLFPADALGKTSSAAVVRVNALLRRLDTLARSTERDRAVVATFAARGVGADERRRLAASVRRVVEMPEATDDRTASSSDKTVDTEVLLSLRAWLRPWTRLARRAIERADLRERLGLRHRSPGRPIRRPG